MNAGLGSAVGVGSEPDWHLTRISTIVTMEIGIMVRRWFSRRLNTCCLIALATALASPALAVTYQYDQAGRLSRAEYDNGFAIDYSYDSNGNLLERSITQQPQIGTLSFAVSAISVSENVGSLDIEVSRSIAAIGPVSVDFGFSDGSATNGVDYNGTPGVLTWPDGDFSPRVISVTLVDDQAVETDEDFSISLTNPSGNAQLGGISTIVITVIDDENNIFFDGLED